VYMALYFFFQSYSIRHIAPIYCYLIIGKGPPWFRITLSAVDLYQIKKSVRGGIAQHRVVFEHDQFARIHFPTRCGVVMVEHIDQ